MSRYPNVRTAVLALTVLWAGAGAGEYVRATIASEKRCGTNAVTVPPEETLTDLGGWEALAVLGGFRVALADLSWIRMTHAWEQSDRPATMRSLRLAMRLNPASLYFWINGARVIAYDMAAWRIQEIEGKGHAPRAAKERLIQQQGIEALEVLAKAGTFFPGRAVLEIEKAQIELHALRNPVAAAARFAVAANCADAPRYCVRIAAELMRKEGRPKEAHALLKQRLQRLAEQPQTGEAAQAAEEQTIVMSRIRLLEKEL